MKNICFKQLKTVDIDVDIIVPRRHQILRVSGWLSIDGDTASIFGAIPASGDLDKYFTGNIWFKNVGKDGDVQRQLLGSVKVLVDAATLALLSGYLSPAQIREER